MKLQERVNLFQQRLRQVIHHSGLNRSSFASSIKVDRSTLSQLLSAENLRLPRADTVIAIADVTSDSDPIDCHLKHIDRTVSSGFYSRLREVNQDSGFSVLG